MRNKIGILSMVLGVICIIVAGSLLAYNYNDEQVAANASGEVTQLLAQQLILNSNGNAENSASGYSAVSADAQEEVDWITPMDITMPDDGINTDGYIPVSISVGSEAYVGILDIPALRLSLPVNEVWSMTKLRRTPCRYWGSAETGNLVIAAHNYKNHFANLSALINGDEVIFTSADGIRYEYVVKEITTVKPEESEKLIFSEYELTLFTCTYDGTERVVVSCSQVAVGE